MSHRQEQIVNVMSIDVEDYYQVGAFETLLPRSEWDKFEPRVEQNTAQILRILDRHDVKATFFVLGHVAERWPGIVQGIVRGGHELAAHGFDHRRVTSMTQEEFRHDVRRTKALLEDISGVEVIGYRAPSYSISSDNLWALDVLVQEGFRYDSSIFPIHHDHYGIPNAPRHPWPIRDTDEQRLLEFPISTLRLLGVNLPFVGGGYLRHFPFWYVKWGMKRTNRSEGHPVMVYIHPWELDPDQPRVNARWLTRVRHYRNLSKTSGRLEALLRDFRFSTVRDVLGI